MRVYAYRGSGRKHDGCRSEGTVCSAKVIQRERPRRDKLSTRDQGTSEEFLGVIIRSKSGMESIQVNQQAVIYSTKGEK
jgi:hypothetical protein